MNWEKACFILGIEPTATKEEIQDQYRYKVQLLHPDWNSNKPVIVRTRAEDELKLVNEAYDVLKHSTNKTVCIPPKLDISVQKIRFNDVELGQKKSTSFEVRSVGGTYTKVWIDDAPAPWLKVTNVKSLTGELLPVEVTIEATGSGEPDKDYACNLLVSLENEETKARDEAVIKVKLRMNAEPGVLKLWVKNIVKSKAIRPGNRELFRFELSNTGRGLLQGHMSSTRPWLNISPDTVAIPPSTRTTYTVKIAPGTLHSGFNDKAIVNIITNGGDDRIPFELSMGAFPGKWCRALLYFIPGYLFALAPLLIIPIHLTPNFWREPIFWAGAGLYAFYLTFIGGLVYKLHSWISRRKSKLTETLKEWRSQLCGASGHT